MEIVLRHAGRWLRFSNPKKVFRAERIDQVLPMLREAEASGLHVAGFVSYEAAPAFDDALKVRRADGFPLLCLGLFDAPQTIHPQEHGAESFHLGALAPSVSKAEFIEAIDRIKERIAAGDTYQVNYTYRLNGDFSGDAWNFFVHLVDGQSAGCAAYVDIGDLVVCSASPELFFEAKDGCIRSRPMKGTAPRGRDFDEDVQRADALRNSAKDRAENIMIVDMVRNDIGRIAHAGSVRVASAFDIEKYPTAWQMTSTVEGGTSAGLTDIFTALFPCASITGAPKAKTMEIVRELENTPRTIYTGSIGFATPTGEAFFSVAIRTALIDRRAGRLEYGVGGGIVWDSDAESEYAETLTKAKVLTEPRPDFQLLETLLWEPGQGFFLLELHLERLKKSAAYFDIRLDVHAINESLNKAVSGLNGSPHRIRLLVARDGTCECETCPVSPDPAACRVFCLADEPVDSGDRFLYHKTTHRTAYDTAKAAHPDMEEVVLWSERGEITEGCISNVVIRKDGRLVTPPVRCGLLAGTFRESLLASGEIEEYIITVEALRAAEEIYFINSVRKWQKARWAREVAE